VLAGLMHDWGKVLKPYQDYLRRGLTHPPIRHEVASFIALTALTRVVNRRYLRCYAALAGSVLYHHHGLYDFTEKVNKYLRGGIRAWPRPKQFDSNVIDRFIDCLKTYISRGGCGDLIIVSDEEESIVEYLRNPVGSEFARRVLRRASEVEEVINSLRHVVTPLLAAVMMGDNISAYLARRSSIENKRILLMTKASVPTLLPHLQDIVGSLEDVGLSDYATSVPGAFETVCKSLGGGSGGDAL